MIRFCLVFVLLASASAAQAQPAITIFCAGGVTGGGGGTRAEADGRLVRLQRARLERTVETELGRDPATVAAWNAALDRAGFDSLQLRGAGNITCFMLRGQHRISWAFQPPASMPAELREVIQAMRAWRPPP